MKHFTKSIKARLKQLAGLLPFALTNNEKYIRLTQQVIARVCKPNAVCVDAGAHDGKILALFIKHCPLALHYAFEPLPHLFKLLIRKHGSACKVYQLALSDKQGIAPFDHVTSDDAYSSLFSRKDVRFEQVETITVQTEMLDNIIAPDIPVSLIKIDVEGGELNVLNGAKRIIETYHPFILLEFGKGGADAFKVTPAMLFDFLEEADYSISLVRNFLNNKSDLNLSQFYAHYNKGDEYFFIAYPLRK